MTPDEFSRCLGTWTALWRRCLDPKCTEYPNYGGRGITICERWYDLRNFLVDMGPRPYGKTLDRIDNDGNYEPGNCRWATQREQMGNMRRNVWVEIDGVRMLQCEAARKFGIPDATLSRRRTAGAPLTKRRTTGKLSEESATAIRARALRPSDDAALGIEFGVSRMAVSLIRRGIHWPNVGRAPLEFEE